MQGLPGQYDNRAQARSDPSGEHAAVALVIQPVNSMAIGQVVMFVRETAFDDPRRILAQHVWTFELDKKKEHMVQTVYAVQGTAPLAACGGRSVPDAIDCCRMTCRCFPAAS
jgi:hypothetical protein